MQLIGAGIPHHGEKVAANSIAHGFDQTQDGIRGNRSVYRIATALQSIQGRLRCQGVAGGGHSLAGQNFRTRREGRPSNSVSGVALGPQQQCGSQNAIRESSTHKASKIEISSYLSKLFCRALNI
jgi:hypothetical protein